MNPDDTPDGSAPIRRGNTKAFSLPVSSTTRPKGREDGIGKGSVNMAEDEVPGIAHELVRAFNAHDLERIAGLFSDTFLAVSPEGPVGPLGWQRNIEEHFRRFPRCTWTEARVSASPEGFRLEVLWTVDADKPSSKAPRIRTTFTCRLKRDKIDTIRVDYDRETVRRELGGRPH